MLDQTLVGERVRQLRLIQGFSSLECAELLRISAGSMSLLENGRMTLTNELVERAAHVLGCTPEFFAAPDPHQVATAPWLRAYADASKKAVDRVLRDNALAVQMVDQLQLPRIADNLPLFDGDLDDDDLIEVAAFTARMMIGLDEGDVVRNAVRAAERFGCLVLPMEDELGRHLGMSQRVDNVPVVRVARTSEDPQKAIPGDRQRFTVLHEVGHLVLHHDRRPPDTPAEAARYEKQAHRFAAAFLAPADPVMCDLEELGGRVTLNTLAHLKQRWGLAIKAFVVRFRSLGVIDEGQARSLYKQISSRGWTKVEPVLVPNEEAQWLTKAMAAKLGGDALAEASRRSGLSAEYYGRWCDWTPTSAGPIADVVDISARTTTRQATTTSSAQGAQRDDAGDGVFPIAPVTNLAIRGRR